VVEPAQDRGGPPVPLRHQVLDARAAHRDEGELGGDEEPVGEDEGNDGGEGKRGTNGAVLTVVGATGPGTTRALRPLCPGSPENFSVISGRKQHCTHIAVAQVLLPSACPATHRCPSRPGVRRADAAARRSPTSPCRGVLLSVSRRGWRSPPA
jgi:hypothetical protein